MPAATDGLLRAMLGRAQHDDEGGLLRKIWEEAHHEDATQLQIRYESEKLQSYADFPPAFFEHICAEGLESALGAMEDMALHVPMVGGGASSDSPTSSDEESDEEEEVRSAPGLAVDSEDADAADHTGIERHYPVMDPKERREGKVAMAAARTAVAKKSCPNEDYDQPCLDSEEAFTEYANVVPLYRRCRLLSDVHEKYAAHLVDDMGREAAFQGLRDLMLPYLANSDAYNTKRIPAAVIQEELELHARTPAAWCNALYRAGVKPWTISLCGTDACPSLVVKCGLVDPPAQDVGDIANEDIDAASHEDMRGITGDYMVANITLGFLSPLPTNALQALTAMHAFVKAASIRLFVINAIVEVNQTADGL